MSAGNSLSMTQANLQKTLTQLSTGLRINTGSDDAAGLSIANGMQANIAALTQSSQNATNGVGQLQTADGALSQVTTLLNRAVTLATEAANGSITTTGSNSQAAALDTEFQSILSEVNQIGQTTDFNGVNVSPPARQTPYPPPRRHWPPPPPSRPDRRLPSPMHKPAANLSTPLPPATRSLTCRLPSPTPSARVPSAPARQLPSPVASS